MFRYVIDLASTIPNSWTATVFNKHTDWLELVEIKSGFDSFESAKNYAEKTYSGSVEVSHGHLAFIGDYEYYATGTNHGGVVVKANRSNPLDIWGHRQGARFECQDHAWPKLKQQLEALK